MNKVLSFIFVLGFIGSAHADVYGNDIDGESAGQMPSIARSYGEVMQQRALGFQPVVPVDTYGQEMLYRSQGVQTITPARDYGDYMLKRSMGMRGIYLDPR